MPSLILPLIVQVALTFYLTIRVAQTRVQSVKAEPSLMTRGALSPDVWPEKTRQFANCYGNQFELPTLFYVVIILYMITGGPGTLSPFGMAMTVLAWAFVVLRILHMLIHTGANNIRQRFYAFAGGLAALFLMWVVFIVHYLF